MKYRQTFTWIRETLEEEAYIKANYGTQLFGEFGRRLFRYLRLLEDEYNILIRDLHKEHWTITPPPDEIDVSNKTFTWNALPDGINKINIIIPVSMPKAQFYINKLLVVSTRTPDIVKINGRVLRKDAAGITYFPVEPKTVPEIIEIIFEISDSESLPISFTIKEALLFVDDIV